MHRTSPVAFAAVGNAPQPFWRFLEALSLWVRGEPLTLSVQAGPLAGALWPFPTVDYLHRDSYLERIRSAEIVVASAGCGVVSDCARMGKPLILFPRRSDFGEHVNNHQVTFAADLRARPGIGYAENEEALSAEAARLLRSGEIPELGDGAARSAEAIEEFLTLCGGERRQP